MWMPLIVHFTQDGESVAACYYHYLGDTRLAINKMSDVLRVLGTYHGLDKNYVAKALNATDSYIPLAEIQRMQQEGLEVPDLSNNGISDGERGIIVLSSEGIRIAKQNKAYCIYVDIFTLDIRFDVFHSFHTFDFLTRIGRDFNLGFNQTFEEMPIFDLRSPIKIYNWQRFADDFNEIVNPLWNFCRNPIDNLVFRLAPI